MKYPNIKEIEEGRKKILENGLELIQEAELLFEHQRYARSYSLSHLATEELMKIQMLNTIEFKLILGIDINWNRIRRNLRDHKSKITGYVTHKFFYDSCTENDADVKRYANELGKISVYNKLKNDGFYVGLLDDNFCKPSEIIDSSLAKESLERAQDLYAFFEPIEIGMKGKIEKIVKENDRFLRMIYDEKSDLYEKFGKILEEEQSKKNSGTIIQTDNMNEGNRNNDR